MLMTILAGLIALSIAVTWVYTSAFFVLVHENRRYWRVHERASVPSAKKYARAMVIIPCKGLEHKLFENLLSFMYQDHPNYGVTFVVDSKDDSAVPVINQLMEMKSDVETQLIVAGFSDDCGQKVHNIRAAVDQMPLDVDVFVFADSDACPSNTWLRWLVVNLGREGVGARTGYRWMVPRDNQLWTLLGCTINNAIASMLGRGKHFLVWGGSWAIHRKIFHSVGMQQAWNGVLSDDLVASRVLKNSGLNIEFEPKCMCTSNVSFNFRQLTEFLRRQLLIARRYMPYYWAAGMVVSVLTQIGFWGSAICGVRCFLVGNNLWGGLLVGTAVAFYGLGVYRAMLRQKMGRMVAQNWRSFQTARIFDTLAGPLTGFVTLVAMVLSAVGNKISWRGITYYIGGGGRIQLLGRKMEKHPWPVSAPHEFDQDETIRIAPTTETEQTRKAA